MPVPVADPTTSVLAWVRGNYYAFQPALASGSDAATGWNIASGRLPTGLALNATTGLISGTIERESEGSVWTVWIRPSNGSGQGNPIRLTIGVEYAEVEPDGALHALFDLDSGMVAFRGIDQVSEDGLPVVHVKSRDRFPLSLQFSRRRTIVDLPVTSIKVAAKRNEPDPVVLSLQADGEDVPYKEGESETARFLVLLDLSAAAIQTALMEEEGDDGTAIAFLAELQVEWLADLGDEDAVEVVRTSLSFYLMVHRDLLPA